MKRNQSIGGDYIKKENCTWKFAIKTLEYGKPWNILTAEK